MRYAICNELFENQPFAKVCDFVKSIGYHGLEIAPFTLAPHVLKITRELRHHIRRTAERKGLEIVGIHWLLANVVSDVPLYTTSPDPKVRRDTANYFVLLTQLCAEVGGRIMVIGSPNQRNLLPGVSREQALNYAKEVFTPCLNLAAKHNVTLAIEPLGPAETDFLNTTADGIELIQRVNHPNFRLHLDVKAMSTEASAIPQIIKEAARYMVHFHANDPNLLGPGMGDVKFEPIIAALKEVKYEGYLSVEVFDFKPGAEHIARESIKYLKRVCGDPS